MDDLSDRFLDAIRRFDEAGLLRRLLNEDLSDPAASANDADPGEVGGSG